MKARLNFSLPEDASEFNAALCGGRALSALWSIAQHLRSTEKYGEPSDETEKLIDELRDLIPDDLLEESWTL